MSTTRASLSLTREQTRAVDRYAIEVWGIPGVVLMENAGRNAAEHIVRWARRLPQTARPRVAIICGKGNNGGDGFVIARHLVRAGFDVHVFLAAEASTLTGDAAINYEIVEKMGLRISPLLGAADLNAAADQWRGCSILVDALLGTGFEGEVREPYRAIIERINAVNAKLVVAVDVPSGLDVDRGVPGGVAVRATHTVTFVAEKVGYSAKTAKSYLGRVTVADIGVPVEIILPNIAPGMPGAK
jgi:hydroxyethylthiazole kinase-like uncharacterized protein yjeF